MTEHPNAALLRRLYHGDRSVLYANMAPDYVAHVPGSSSVAGDYRGASGHQDHVDRFMSLTYGTIRKQMLDSFIADDRWGLVPSRLVAERGDQSLDMRGFGLWRFDNGKVAEHWGLVTDQEAFDRFFAAAQG